MSISLDIPDPASIGTYDDLVAMVGNWLDRDDLTDRIPEFISLLEARLNRLLRTVQQETAGTWAATGETFNLPSDFRKMRALYPAGIPSQPLAFVTSARLPEYAGVSVPQAYAIEGRTLRFSSSPSTDNPLTLTALYWRRIPPLGTFQPTNWLLDEHPDIYVWGALHQGSTYIRDPEAMDATKAFLDEAIAELQSASRRDAFGGPLAPVTTVQVRGARC